jgi:hypothetical protein
MHDWLRGEVRRVTGKHRHPRARIIDRQSINTTEQGGPRRRYPPTRQRPHTPDPRRYVTVAAGGGGHVRPWARPRWGDAAVGCPAVPVFPRPTELGGSGRCRRPHQLAVGAAAPVERSLGHGQTAGGEQRLPTAVYALDGGADRWVVWPLSPLRQR